MSRKHYIVVLLMLIAGLAASFLLIPRERDIAQMEVKSKLYGDAQRIYEAELAKGDLSIGTVSQITDLYVQGGAIDKAIAIMEKFVADHPDNIDARLRLGQYYQYAQRNGDYVKNLEEINRRSPKPEQLQKLNEIYQFTTEYDKQIDTLKQLIAKPETREPKQYLELANLLAAKKDFAQAAATLRQLQKDYPDQWTYKETQMLATLLYDQGNKDEAYGEIKIWIEAHRDDAEHGASFIGIVHTKDSPQRGAELLALFTDKQIADTQALLEESILLDIALGQEDAAYARLQKVPEKQWSPVVVEQLLVLAATHGDKELVKSLLPLIDLKTMNEAQLARITDAATAYGDDALIAALIKTFPEKDFGETHPLLLAMLAVINHSNTADAALAKLDNVTLTPEQDLQVARVCARSGKSPCVEAFIAKLPVQDTLTDAQIVSVGELYLQLQQWEKGNNYIAEARKTRDSDSIQFIAAKYAAAAGKESELGEWLVAKGNSTVTPMLRDVYFTAYNAGHYKAALLVAKTVHEKEKSETSRRDLANTYIKLGQYADAAALLRLEGKEKLSAENEDIYILALTKLSKDQKYRAELANYATSRLKTNLPRKEKLTLLYALINTKQTDVAAPYIRDLALKEGGQWASLYAEYLDKQGKHDEARDFWMKIAQAKLTSEKEKTAIAYTLLERGYKKDAEAIFKTQAANAAPDSQPVKVLLYIWGPRLNAEQMQWLGSRYATASDKDKTQWANLIANYASTDTLPDVMRANPTLIKNKAVLNSYLQILADEGKFAGSEIEFIDNAKNNDETKLLKTYAAVARVNGHTRESRRAYEALVELNPGDSASLREAGTLAFDQADYSSSKEYLSNYLQDAKAVAMDTEAYRAYYNYGQLAARDNEKEEALHYYRLAYKNVEENKLATVDALSVKAQSQIASGNVEQGLATFRQAMDTHPADDTLRADYIGALIELRRYDEARNLLAVMKPAKISPLVETSTPPVNAADVAGYKLYNNDREAVVTFKKPIGKGASFNEESVKDLPWVAYGTQGYNTLRIVAKPGYRIIENNGSLSAVANDGVPARELQQMALRYELLAARLELETGDVNAATKRLEALVDKNPRDAQVLGFAANAENYAGNWPEALQLLKEARAASAENEDVAELDKSIRRIHGPELILDFEWLSRGDNNEYITTLAGLAEATRHVDIGAKIQNNYADAENVRRADGRIGNFKGHRQQMEIFARYHEQRGWLTQLSLFSNNNTLGAGGIVSFVNPLGQTEVTAEYHRPYWEYTEAVLDDATRSRLGVIHTIKPSNKFTISGGPGLNRYDVDGKNNVISTASADLDVVYRLIDAQLYLALGYSLDGEYTLSQKKDFDVLGNFTPLFPLRTREIHFLSLRGGWEFNVDTYAEGMAGWGIDRFGGNGPAFEGKLTHEFTESIDGQVRAYWGLDTSNTDNNLSRVGGYVRWRY
jgi:tetratricopeptide (TPR) repeat protein